MTKFVVRTWWITLCWSLDTRQPNGSWRIGGAMDGEKTDTCVWQKIKIDVELRIMRHTQKSNSICINWREKKKKKEKKTIHPYWFSIFPIFDHSKSSLLSVYIEIYTIRFKPNREKYPSKPVNRRHQTLLRILFLFSHTHCIYTFDRIKELKDHLFRVKMCDIFHLWKKGGSRSSLHRSGRSFSEAII